MAQGGTGAGADQRGRVDKVEELAALGAGEDDDFSSALQTKVNSPWRTTQIAKQVRPVRRSFKRNRNAGGGRDKHEEEEEAEEVEKQTRAECVSSISISISDPVILMPN